MTTSLQNQVAALATRLASDVLEILSKTSLSELEASGDVVRDRHPSSGGRVLKVGRALGGGAARLPRRSLGELEETAERIWALLLKSPSGMRAEEIKVCLGISKKEFPRPIKLLLDSKRMIAKGQKRATTYFAVSVDAPKKAASKKAAPKKAASKKAAPKKAASKKAASKKVASKKAASKKATSKKAASKKATSKKAASKKVASKKAARTARDSKLGSKKDLPVTQPSADFTYLPGEMV